MFDHDHFASKPDDANLSADDLSSRVSTELTPGFTTAKFPATYSSLRAVTCQGWEGEGGDGEGRGEKSKGVDTK